MESKVKNKSSFARKGIITLSVVIPIVVGALFKIDLTDEGHDLSFLPPIYAAINGLTAILLVAALLAIKKRNITTHQFIIQTCLLLSLLFLACYVAYHITTKTTSYRGDFTYIYFFILVTHIILSVAVVPLVLFTYLFAWEGNYAKHKKWAKIAWPLWFYVAISGVIVYLMISPYY